MLVSSHKDKMNAKGVVSAYSAKNTGVGRGTNIVKAIKIGKDKKRQNQKKKDFYQLASWQR